MAIISLKKIQEVSKNAKKTQEIDLGKYIDKNLEGIVIPIKVKSLEETLDIKSKTKLDLEKLTLEYKPFLRMPKKFRDMYMKSDKYRRGMTENTYFQICKHSEDEIKIERNKYRERLFSILIHIDMDYIIDKENNKTMWEDAGLTKGDYNGLIDIFSGVITYERHLDILDIVIDKIKSGVTDEDMILASIFQYNIGKTIESIEDEAEKKLFIENYRKALEEIQESVQKETENIKDENIKDENIEQANSLHKGDILENE